MLDDYSRRLLAEIGVDVYLPRAPALTITTVAEPASVPPVMQMPAVTEAFGSSTSVETVIAADVLVLCERREPTKLLGDLIRALGSARLRGAFGEISDPAAISSVRGLLVLGESLARELGPALSAQQQNAITWVVAIEPSALARSADAKRALWGEIKRLSHTLARPPAMA